MVEIATLLLLAAGEPAEAATAAEAGAVAARPKADAGAEAALPPEITTDGLQAELRRSAKDHRAQLAKISDERAQLAAQREELKKASADIANARASLKQESSALRDQLRRAPAPAAPEAAPTASAPAKGPYDRLSKTLRGMKPQQAAQLLVHLEPGLAVNLLGQMKPADLGEVLDQLKPEQAAQLISALASRAVSSSSAPSSDRKAVAQ